MDKHVIELDDGKILTGKPDQFDGKNHGFPVKIFPSTNPLNMAKERTALPPRSLGSGGCISSQRPGGPGAWITVEPLGWGARPKTLTVCVENHHDS